MIILENCSNSVESSIEAQKGGAARVELCDNLADGGTTPSQSQIELTRKYIDIDLNVIIRPRGGDFLYSDIEFESMKLDIYHCGNAGVDGVVIGCLDADGNIDMERNKLLIDIARKYNMSVTFHRAFDRCKDLMQSLEDIITLGCDRILTSGGKNTALEGKDVIKQLIEKAENRIIVMPGAGITELNIAELVAHTGLKEFHGSFRNRVAGGMRFTNNTLGTHAEEYMYQQTDSHKIALAIENANKKH